MILSHMEITCKSGVVFNYNHDQLLMLQASCKNYTT